MNKIYKVKFDVSNNTSVVTSELAKQKGKVKITQLATAVTAAIFSTVSFANAPSNDVTNSAGYTTNEVITLANDTENGVVVNLSQDQAEKTTNFYHNDNIDFTGKYSHSHSAIAVGGNTDSDKPKATLSLKDVSITLNEDVKEIAVKKTPNPLLWPFIPKEIITPTETTERYFSGVKAAFGGSVYMDKLALTFNPQPLKTNPDDKKFAEIHNNAYVIGVLAGTEGSSTVSEKSSGLKNNVVIGDGGYTFVAKRTLSEPTSPFEVPPTIVGLQAVQNNDIGSFGLISPTNKQITPIPTGKSPQAEITVKGKYEADIEGNEAYGLIVSGQATADQPMPTVNLADTTINLNAKKGSALKVGAAITTVEPKAFVANIAPDTNALGGLLDGLGSVFGRFTPSDAKTVLEKAGYTVSPELAEKLKSPIPINNGGGAGLLTFKQGSKVDIKAVGEDYLDASIVVAHAGSKLDASKVDSFKTEANYTALRVGDASPTTKSTEGDIVVNINNPDFTIANPKTDRTPSLFPRSSLIHVETEETEKALIKFTSDKTSNLVAHKQGLLLNVTGGNAVFEYVGNGAENSQMTGALGQSSVIKPNGRTAKVFVGHLDATIDNAKWNLGHKDAASFDHTTYSHFSSASSITLKNNAVLDATVDSKADNLDPYIIQLEVIKANPDYTYNPLTNDQPPSVLRDGVGKFTIENSLINLANNGKYHDELLINGDYHSNGGMVKMDTLWNANQTAEDLPANKSDRLIIDGKVTGQTKVIPVSKDGVENFIDGNVANSNGEIRSPRVVIITDLDAKADSFTGEARTTNAGSVQLASSIITRGENNQARTLREFYWTNLAKDNAGNLYNIVDKALPGYLLNYKANLELGRLTMDTLIERRAERNEPVWVRVLGKKVNLSGVERFDLRSHLAGVQVSYDFNKSVTNDYTAYSTVFLTHGTATSRFADRYSAENASIIGQRETGSAKARSLGFGLSHTVYKNDGLYLDSLIQVAKLKNKFSSNNGYQANQSGWTAGLSLEAGKSFKLNPNWRLEPQAQFTYQLVKYSAFNDGSYKVAGYKVNDAEARIGARAVYDMDTNKSLYVVANLKHSLTPAAKVRINGKFFDERINRTRGEVGIGGQIMVANNLSIYSDIRAEKDIDGERYHSYKGNLGIKYQW